MKKRSEPDKWFGRVERREGVGGGGMGDGGWEGVEVWEVVRVWERHLEAAGGEGGGKGDEEGADIGLDGHGRGPEGI